MSQISLTQKQADFLTAQDFATLFAAGVGCIHPDTPIVTADGIKIVSEIKTPQLYKSLENGRITFSLGTAPYLKGHGDLFQVVHERGQFVAFGSHLIFSSSYKYERVCDNPREVLCGLQNVFDQPSTILELCLSKFDLSEIHWTQTVANCLDDYLICCRQYGLQPLFSLNSVQELIPLLGDALKSCLEYGLEEALRLDGQKEPLPNNIHLDQLSDHSYNQDFSHQLNRLTLILADSLLALVFERILLGTKQSLLYQSMSEPHHTMILSSLCRKLAFSLTRAYSASKILSIERVGSGHYFDLKVANSHNYISSDGVIHHNSGKSFIGSHWAKEKINAEPRARGFIGANTYNQLRNATLATFFGVLDEHNIRYKYNQQRNIIMVNGTVVYAYSLDNYQNIRGIEIGWGWLDETRDTPKEAFDVVLGRLRDKRAKKLELRLTSSPCGYNWLYDYFAGPQKKPGYRIVQGASHDNPFLPASYVESLKDSYDEKMYQQEVLGLFVTTGVGQVYYSFNRTRNVMPVKRETNYPLMVGMDFNINPMSAVVFQCIGPEIRVIDEISLMSSDTSEMGKFLLNKYGSVRIIPDSTGKRKQTSSKGLSDHQILKDLGHQVVYNANPARFDRYVCVNNLLEKDRLKIDPKCKHLIADLEKVTYRAGTTEPDSTSDKSLTHMSDALGYGCWFCFPVIKHSGGVSMVDR